MIYYDGDLSGLECWVLGEEKHEDSSKCSAILGGVGDGQGEILCCIKYCIRVCIFHKILCNNNYNIIWYMYAITLLIWLLKRIEILSNINS